MRYCSDSVWSRTILKLLKLQCWTNVGPMPANQKWRVFNNFNHYPTLAQRLLAIWGPLSVVLPGTFLSFGNDSKNHVRLCRQFSYSQVKLVKDCRPCTTMRRLKLLHNCLFMKYMCLVSCNGAFLVRLAINILILRDSSSRYHLKQSLESDENVIMQISEEAIPE